jgi:hypothetical protein
MPMDSASPQSSHSKTELAREMAGEFLKNGLGVALSFLRRQRPNLHPLGAATLGEVRGGAAAGVATALGSVALRNLRGPRSSSKQALFEFAHEGMAEAICGGVSALAAATSGVAASKFIATAGLTGIKTTALLVGVPLASAVVTTVVARQIYDRTVSSRITAHGLSDHSYA